MKLSMFIKRMRMSGYVHQSPEEVIGEPNPDEDEGSNNSPDGPGYNFISVSFKLGGSILLPTVFSGQLSVAQALMLVYPACKYEGYWYGSSIFLQTLSIPSQEIATWGLGEEPSGESSQDSSGGGGSLGGILLQRTHQGKSKLRDSVLAGYSGNSQTTRIPIAV